MKPMLAATIEDVNDLKFPLYGSPKLDGIRCLIYNRRGLTRKLKPIPNKYIKNVLKQYSNVLEDYDGELLVGNNFQETTSAIMSFEGNPKFTYHIFDYIDSRNYYNRFLLKQHPKLSFVRVVPQTYLNNINELEEFEINCLADGYEGVVLRRADGLDRYKFGRSTINEAYLLKLKRFFDDEAEIIGFEERLHNDNILEIDNLGYAKRSSKQNGMILTNTLGAFLVYHITFGSFSIGTGITDEQRKEIWNNKEKYLGKRIKFKYQQLGIKNKPRFPVFLGFRHKDDF